MTEQEAIDAALLEFSKVVGTVIEVSEVHGYVDEEDFVWSFDSPIKVMVLPTPDKVVADNTSGICIESLWDVDIVEETLKPEYQKYRDLTTDVRCFWVHGNCYEIWEDDAGDELPEWPGESYRRSRLLYN